MGDIADAIRGCRITLFISSSDSNKSMYTAKEVAMAFNEGKYIIPYKIDDSEFHRNLELVMCDLNYIEAIPFDEAKAATLVDNIINLLNGKRSGEALVRTHRVYIDVTQWNDSGGRFVRFIKNLFRER